MKNYNLFIEKMHNLENENKKIEKINKKIQLEKNLIKIDDIQKENYIFNKNNQSL